MFEVLPEGNSTVTNSGDTLILLDRATQGCAQALGELLLRYEERLLRVVAFRMDSRLKARIDPGDVVQETFLEATRRFPAYAEDYPMPFFLWLRFLAVQKLTELHRRHLGVKARDLQREVSIYAGPTPPATSAVLAAQLLGKFTSPSEAAMRVELKLRLEEKLNEMETLDREVLALRHFEQLSNSEAAGVLGINESAASNRYVRALRRLREAMEH